MSVLRLIRLSAKTTLEAMNLAKILDAAGPDASNLSLHGGSQVLAEAFASFFGSGYRAELVDCPTFDSG